MRSTAIHFRASGTGGGYICPRSKSEVASLIGCQVEDMTELRYGQRGVMFMSLPAQKDRDAPVNRSATIVIDKLNGIPVGIRGDVVVFPQGLPNEFEG